MAQAYHENLVFFLLKHKKWQEPEDSKSLHINRRPVKQYGFNKLTRSSLDWDHSEHFSFLDIRTFMHLFLPTFLTRLDSLARSTTI